MITNTVLLTINVRVKYHDRMSPDRSSTALPPFPGTPRRRRRTAKAPLTVDRIVDAALDVMAAEGYEAITMRRVAQQLGTGPASLYAHLSSKRDLDALIVDRVATEVTVPDPDPAHWAEQVIAVMRELRTAMTRHPGVARAVIGYIPTGPEALLITERLLAIMLAGGVSAAGRCLVLRPAAALCHRRRLRGLGSPDARRRVGRLAGRVRRAAARLLRGASGRPFPQPGRHRQGADDGRRRGQVRVRPAGAARGLAAVSASQRFG